jgi:stearoyl-CoA desaturase (delta-9 desaturase)
LRRALANGGRWLDDDERRRLNAWIDTRPCLRTLCHFRAQLALLMEQRDIEAGARGLSQWVQAATDSDIVSLRTFAEALAGDASATP